MKTHFLIVKLFQAVLPKIKRFLSRSSIINQRCSPWTAPFKSSFPSPLRHCAIARWPSSVDPMWPWRVDIFLGNLEEAGSGLRNMVGEWENKRKTCGNWENLGDLVIEAFLHPSHSLLGFRTGWMRTKCQKRGQTNNMDSALYRCRQQSHSPTGTKKMCDFIGKTVDEWARKRFFQKKQVGHSPHRKFQHMYTVSMYI